MLLCNKSRKSVVFLLKKHLNRLWLLEIVVPLHPLSAQKWGRGH